VATLTTFAIALPGSSLLAYVVLGLIVGSESSGVPLPGETTLFIAAFAAHDGQLSIPVVIAVAAAGAIIGDNLGYLFGRRLGRRFLERPGRFEEHRREALVRGEKFFARHGAKAVFLGRWITGLRVWASWLAGITHLPWPTFIFWNALGGICWATSVGLAGYFAGHAAEKVIQKVGLGALIAFGVGAVIGFVWFRRRRRERLRIEQDGARVRPETE
jgi:membrane protein DedA with SNARE-associated domain